MSTEPDLPLEVRAGWGMASRVVTHVVRPTTAEQVAEAFELARARGWTVVPWGNGRSYGDAALNDGHLTLDLRDMRQITDFNAETGLVTLQPGLTLGELWQHALPLGWWPPVVSGTMTTTLGGCAAANIHGKNNFKHGPIGEHIQGFTLVTPDGRVHRVTRESDPNLFFAAIGGFGALGVFTSITLQLKRVHSGRLEVQPESHPDLQRLFTAFERYGELEWDYVVGWIDAFGRGNALGRGNLHAARYVGAGEDPEARAWLRPDRQALPSTLLGFPKKWIWRFMRPFANRPGMRLINLARYLSSSRDAAQQRHLQAHARFNFLLDYVPDWKRIYQPHGMVQIQIFVPHDRAQSVIRRVLELQQGARYESFLVVMKRHRRDPFWLSHAVDGFSFAMDFPVWPKRRADLVAMSRRIEALVVEAGGRFYLAKDSLLSPASFRESLGDEVLGHFFGLKRALDPDGRLGSNQYRRVIAPLHDQIAPISLAPGQTFSVAPPVAELAEVPDPAEVPEPVSAPPADVARPVPDDEDRL